MKNKTRFIIIPIQLTYITRKSYHANMLIYDKKTKKMVALQAKINSHLVDKMGAKKIKWESKNMLGLARLPLGVNPGVLKTPEFVGDGIIPIGGEGLHGLPGFHVGLLPQ